MANPEQTGVALPVDIATRLSSSLPEDVGARPITPSTTLLDHVVPTPTRPGRTLRRSIVATGAALTFGLSALGLAACSPVGSTLPDRPGITTSAAATTSGAEHSVGATATQSPKPTESPTPKPEVGIASTIDVDHKEVPFTLLTPDQLKDHWEDFAGKDIGLVVHPHRVGKTLDVIDINILGVLYTGKKTKPTDQFVMGNLTFSNGDRFALFYEYLTTAQQEQANDAAGYNILPTDNPFLFVGKVAPMQPGLLYSLLKTCKISTKGINPDFALLNVKTAPNTNGIRNASTP